MFLAAVLQMTSTSDSEANWEQAKELIDRAAGYGSQIVATPENTNFLGSHEDKVKRAEDLDGPVCRRFAELAETHRIFVLLGSFNERSDDTERCFNTSVLFGPDGSILAVYRKIHLFDVDLSPEVRFEESRTVCRGDRVVLADTELARVGLSICYDLRFPWLYDELGARGAEILTVPSAFTLRTGMAHWIPLLRARAIENQCFVLAPAQHGKHEDQGLRESFGQAAIIDPWGQVLATSGDGPGLALAEIEIDRLRRVRSAMPVRDHRGIR